MTALTPPINVPMLHWDEAMNGNKKATRLGTTTAGGEQEARPARAGDAVSLQLKGMPFDDQARLLTPLESRAGPATRAAVQMTPEGESSTPTTSDPQPGEPEGPAPSATESTNAADDPEYQRILEQLRQGWGEPLIQRAGVTVSIAIAIDDMQRFLSRMEDAARVYDRLEGSPELQEDLRDAGFNSFAVGWLNRYARLLNARIDQVMLATRPPNAGEPPVLPSIGEIDRLQAVVEAIRGQASGVTMGMSYLSLVEETSAMLDVCVALHGALALQSGRSDWEIGYQQPPTLNESEMELVADLESQGVDAQHAGEDVIRGDHPLQPSGSRPPVSPDLDRIFEDGGQFNRAYPAGQRPYNQVANWCGFFVAGHHFRSAGLDSEIRSGMWHANHVPHLFNYAPELVSNEGRVKASIWDADAHRWKELETYHRERGSLRTYLGPDRLQEALAAGNNPFRPGDAVSIRRSDSGPPGHVGMVDSYDPELGILHTTEGNIRDGQTDRADGARRGAREGVGTEHRVATAEELAADVYGVGHFSIVDYENHDYSNLSISEFEPAALVLSPDEMRQRAVEEEDG